MRKMTFFWMRRDLRLQDNIGLFRALTEKAPVQPLFIFDSEILDKLDDPTDARVSFLHQTLLDLKEELRAYGADLWVRHGRPLEVWKRLVQEHTVEAVYANHDYEPAARKRDGEVSSFLANQGIAWHTFKDQCLFEKDEILTDAGKGYTVYTPYKRKVLATLKPDHLRSVSLKNSVENFHHIKSQEPLLSLSSLGFQKSPINFPPLKISQNVIRGYDKTRDFPALASGTTRLGLHLRFGTVSVRELARKGMQWNQMWLSELIWRDFFMQILWRFPHVEKTSFRPEFEKIAWRTSASDFERWSNGQTGYPLVDAGMRELNATGYIHNRVRMVVASFLTKHLLIHWHEGERYFARKLLDYDLAANNGNWQWAAGTGCDAAPYFRIFNPMTQAKRFDPRGEYVRRWVPEVGTSRYVKPIIDHQKARVRALEGYARVFEGE